MKTGKRIMVVDDDPRIQAAVKRILDLRGYAVSTALSGRECLEKMALGTAFDLVLLDIMMSDIDGQTAYRTISKKYPKTRVIFMSALQPAEDTKKTMTAMGDKVTNITKPFTSELLLSTVKKALGEQ